MFNAIQNNVLIVKKEEYNPHIENEHENSLIIIVKALYFFHEPLLHKNLLFPLSQNTLSFHLNFC